MIRISALNDEGSDDSNGLDSELIVTKEAEETIAISEYVRALQMKKENKQQEALELLLELLDTQVINDVTSTQTDSKLFAVKYNCYRNIGLIYEEQSKESLAIEFLMKAMDLDETDVYTMSRLARMALKTGYLQISKLYFEKCLKRNPNHWPSMEGLLRVFCSASNVVEAYGWASQCNRKDPRNTLYLDVLRAIRERFKSTLPYLDTIFIMPPAVNFQAEEKRRPLEVALATFDELFTAKPAYEPPDFTIMPDILKQELKMDDISFETIGNMLVKLNDKMEELDLRCVFMLETDSLFCERHKEEGEKMEEVTQETPTVAESVDDTVAAKEDNRMEVEEEDMCEEANETSVSFVKLSEDGNGNGTSAADSADSGVDANEQKNKARRRGSELKILEQWGWHKNRRSTRKKSIQELNDPADSTVESFFKLSVKQHLSEEKQLKKSPFTLDQRRKSSEGDDGTDAGTEIAAAEVSAITQSDFCSECNLHAFINEMKQNDIDVYALMYGFLVHISRSWGIATKAELHPIYLKLHNSFVQYTDYEAWNQLSPERLELIFQISVFYLELKLDAGLAETRDESRGILDAFDDEIFNRCRFYVDSLPNERTVAVYRIRLQWIAYIVECSAQKFDAALENLYLLQDNLCHSDGQRIVLNFPNQQANTCVSLEKIEELIGEAERKLRIERVRRHYEDGEHEQVVDILKDTLRYYTTVGNPNETVLSLTMQSQMLLESLWSIAEMEECLIWAEKVFTYSVHQFVVAAGQHDSRKTRTWASNVNFAQLYIHSIIKQEGFFILEILGSQTSRLIQSLYRLLTHQLDPSVEKNYTAQLCLIDCWRAWIVFYYILERQDDLDCLIKVNQTPSIQDQNGTIESDPERLCNSVMMCFVAHELLGKKNWCSKGESGLLFHILDVVVPKIRSPLLEPFREILNEYLEQVTYCLYGYPQKRPRLRHIHDHGAVQVSLNWTRAVQLFDLYRPDNLPEFNSYKLESISADMEALLQRIIALIPTEIDVTKLSLPISEFIDGKGNTLPDAANVLQSEIKPIFYLLADYYFKSRDFTRAIKYYVMDLALEPTRFDSWAGISLSKASRVETKLNSTEVIPLQEFLDETDNGMKCFDQCLQLNENDAQLWIEYGSFAYNIHSFCSRSLKLLSDTLSMESFALVETHKERCLDIAFSCFNKVSLEKISSPELSKEVEKEQQQQQQQQHQHQQQQQESGNNHEDEIWLHHYMLGKIAEKKKEHPAVYLTHYLKSAKYLYECNATYPIKINHSSPSQLAIEALEVFYRINAAIIKYVEQHSPIKKKTSRLFLRTLKELATSPFAVNRAKINENMLKRKISPNNNGSNNAGPPVATNAADTSVPSPKVARESEAMAAVGKAADEVKQQSQEGVPDPDGANGDKLITVEPLPSVGSPPATEMPSTTSAHPSAVVADENVPSSASANQQTGRVLEHVRVEVIKQLVEGQPARRGSQESAVTSSTTTTTTTTSTSSSSSDSSDSDTDTSSDSDSDTSSTEDELTNEQTISTTERDTIFKHCIKNLEECITRFPEHYKSMYRLVHHYMHAPGDTKSFDKARQLLLGNYRTTLGTQIPGLFTERKTTNFFNGLWRIPASDIDRPGNFASHISKCVIVLMETLKEFNEHEILVDLAMQLQRTPEPDKKYLNDYERKELVQQAMLYCIQVYRSMLKKAVDARNDTDLLSLMIDAYKAYRKILKVMPTKEPMFACLLTDAYRAFVSDKVAKLPDNSNVLDLSIKLCTYEINYRKTQEKQQNTNGSGSGSAASSTAGANGGKQGGAGEVPATMIVPMQPISANFIPGLTKQNRRIPMSKVTTPTMATNPLANDLPSIHQQLQQQQQQHNYQMSQTHPYGAPSSAIGSMMTDLSSRVTITPIMLDTGTAAAASAASSTSGNLDLNAAKHTAATVAAALPPASAMKSSSQLSDALPSASCLTGSAAAGASTSSTALFQQYLKIFSQMPNIASIGNNPMMTAALTEYLATFKMHQSATSSLSPNPDRNTDTPPQLPASTMMIPKASTTVSSKHYSSGQAQSPQTFPTSGVGGKKSGKSSSSVASPLLYSNFEQQQQLATITLSTIGASHSSTNVKRDRVSSPFAGSSTQRGAGRVASPLPMLTITPSDGPVPTGRQKQDSSGNRKAKSKKALGTRPTPYARPTPPPPAIPQLGVPGLSIEPVLVPGMLQPPITDPNISKFLSAATAGTSKSSIAGTAATLAAPNMKDLVATYTELMKKYPMARSLLLPRNEALNTQPVVPPPVPKSKAGTGRKQSAKQSAANKATSTATASSSAAVNRVFHSGTTPIPRIGATITPLPAGFPVDGYARTVSPAGNTASIASLSPSSGSMPSMLQQLGGSNQQQQAKTLQQKLAERQKANKARETESVSAAVGSGQGSSGKQPKPSADPVDVIVLE
ncbi:calcineurin-binding protein cabin-1-like [Anopheles aquasalis]|uniref:calcineurin-binding protein cabin-1-like n=1 Tax=Anopheles aquasalis TaxID=42839 RepID=UPI00215AAC92|nr:calcineurin-binding protein cabin-1-like [Anopheles aquasalis]